MNPTFLSLPDDWLALAWCFVTMTVCLLLIHAAASIRPRPTRRNVAPAKQTTGCLRATRTSLDRSPSMHGVEPYVAAYRLRFSNSRLPVRAPRMRLRPWLGR